MATEATEIDETGAGGAADVVDAPIDTQKPAVENGVSADVWAGLSDEARGFVQNKGWQSPADMFESYRSLERLRGVGPDKILRLPDDPADMGEVWDRLGRPAEPAEYKVDLPDEYKDGVYNEMANAAHGLGLTQDQWAGLSKIYTDIGTGLQEQRAQEMVDSISNYQAENPTTAQNVRRLLAAVGAGEDTVADALSGDVGALYETLSKVSSRMGELPTVDSGDAPQGFTGMTAEQAKAKRAEKYGDPKFMERLRHSDAKVRAAANKEIEGLTRIIVGEESNDAGEMERLRQDNARMAMQLRQRM